jgi:hypothetical protein
MGGGNGLTRDLYELHVSDYISALVDDDEEDEMWVCQVVIARRRGRVCSLYPVQLRPVAVTPHSHTHKLTRSHSGLVHVPLYSCRLHISSLSLCDHRDDPLIMSTTVPELCLICPDAATDDQTTVEVEGE